MPALTTLASLIDRATDRELTLHEAFAEGWGHPSTLRKRVKDGRLPAEQVDDRGTYVVLESDLMRQPDLVRLRRSRGIPLPARGTQDEAVNLDDLASLAARLVATWPELSAERKRELGRLLAD
jgi:hypothetical protein